MQDFFGYLASKRMHDFLDSWNRKECKLFWIFAIEKKTRFFWIFGIAKNARFFLGIWDRKITSFLFGNEQSWRKAKLFVEITIKSTRKHQMNQR